MHRHALGALRRCGPVAASASPSSSSSSCSGGAAMVHALLIARRSYLVQFATTPNDECMRFYVEGQGFLEGPAQLQATLSFDQTNSFQSPLAEAILTSLPMVDEVTIGHDFVTVRKMDAEEYEQELRAASSTPVTDSSAAFQKEAVSEADAGPSRDDSPDHERSVNNSNSGEPQPASTSDAAGGATAAAEDIHDEILRKGSTNEDGIVTLDEATLRRLVKLADWADLKMTVSAIITDHLYSGRPHVALGAPHPHQDTLPSDGDSEIVASIKELVASTIRPELQRDGGDIRFVSFREDADAFMVVELLGACKTCKSSKTTLQDLIERTTRHWIPEVQGVEAWVRKKGVLTSLLTGQPMAEAAAASASSPSAQPMPAASVV